MTGPLRKAGVTGWPSPGIWGGVLGLGGRPLVLSWTPADHGPSSLQLTGEEAENLAAGGGGRRGETSTCPCTLGSVSGPPGDPLTSGQLARLPFRRPPPPGAPSWEMGTHHASSVNRETCSRDCPP